MSEMRKVVETELPPEEAYAKVFKRATQLGYNIVSNIKNKKLELEWENRNALWWIAFIVGLIFYIIPGILVWLFWKPKDRCTILFDKNQNGGTVVTFIISGPKALEFYNEVIGLLL